MAIYDKHADTPDRLKFEGQEITVKLVRNGDGTATIKWNIPSPPAGGELEDLIYDGVVILVSSRPANYLTSSPQNNVYYNADPTFDGDLHAGDSIGVSNVVGAFYHDRTTVSFTVTDVVAKTPYYVSAYPVDQNGNYFREGIHAYSIPTDMDETDKSQAETAAFHDIQVDTPEGITIKELTGLARGTNYSLSIELNGDCIEYNDLLGSTMQTYEDMAAELNSRFKLLTNPLLGPDFPNTGKYQVNDTGTIVWQWDGSQNVEQTDTIFLSTDPTIPILDTYWYKASTDELKVRDSAGWSLIANTSIIEFPTDPSDPADGTVWFDKVLDSSGSLDTTNSAVWIWKDGTWCKQPTIIQVRSPLLPPVLGSADYWYNETTGTVSVRNTELRRWDEVDPIVWDTDPNTLADGNYWYSTTTEIVLVRVAGVWENVGTIRYEEADGDGELPSPPAAPSTFWFIPSTQQLFQRDLTGTLWVEINIVIAGADPITRTSCDVWWDVTTAVDTLFKWDDVNSEWDAVNSFTQSETDPALPPTLTDGSYWYNPDTEELQKITGLNCADVVYICSSYDPVALPVGFVWFNTTDETWYLWDGAAFNLLTVIEAENDPFAVSDGVLWFDGASLWLRVSGAWVEQDFTLTSLAPATGTFYLSSITDILYQWDGTSWVEHEGLMKVTLEFDREVCFDEATDIDTDLFSPFNDFERFGRDMIRFQTIETGCNQKVAVDHRSTVFSSLNKPIINYTPATGRSQNEAGSTARELGVATDGTPDERRRLQDRIRVSLGSEGIQVELSKQQLDECIDNALLMVRKYSSYSYQRNLFFMDVFPNQQKYIMINKCVGFHRIININACYRMRTGFLGASQGTFGGYDIYGYAALQQLYSLGTFDMLSYHLVSSYLEDLQYLFADNLVFDFYEDTRILAFHQIFYNNERVMVDATIDLPEQLLITNRNLEMWIKKWAIAEAKMILSQVRGKFQSLPGPNGSTTLNSQELITQAENEKSELREELFDRSMQDHNSDVASQFLIG